MITDIDNKCDVCEALDGEPHCNCGNCDCGDNDVEQTQSYLETNR